MHVADLASGLGQLSQAYAKLSDEWALVCEHWTDDARRKFGEAYLDPLPPRLKLLVAAANQLQSAIAAAERELDDRPDIEA
jgi:hypothetical protein